MLKNGVTANNSQVSAKYFAVIWGCNDRYAPVSAAEIFPLAVFSPQITARSARLGAPDAARMSCRRCSRSPDFAHSGSGQGQAEDSADASARGEAQLAAMGAHQFAGDREAQTAAAGTGRAEERTEQVLPRLGRQAGAVIGYLDRDRRRLAHGGKAQPVRPGFDRIAGEVEEHPVELIAVGLDDEIGRDRVLDRQIVLGDRETGADFVDQRRQRKARARERRSLLDAIDRAVALCTR